MPCVYYINIEINQIDLLAIEDLLKQKLTGVLEQKMTLLNDYRSKADAEAV